MMRKGFSMLMAIAVIVIMAGITAMVMNLSGKVVKEISSQYRHEQAALLAKSYTEYAILAIQGHNGGVAGINCLRTVQGQLNSLNGVANANGVINGEGYQVDVRIQYAGLRLNQPAGMGCAVSVANTYGHASLGYQNTVGDTTTSNDVSATIDVYVMYHDLDVIANLGANGNNNAWITYHRRTLQRL